MKKELRHCKKRRILLRRLVLEDMIRVSEYRSESTCNTTTQVEQKFDIVDLVSLFVQ